MTVNLRSLLKIAGKVLLTLLLILALLIIFGVVFGIAKRGLHQQEYLSYPYPQVPVQLPRDHAAHPDFKTEWWYYTGHLQDKDGNRYGFELTFFRIRTVNMWEYHLPVWWFMYPHGMAAHLAISDIKNRRFFGADIIQKNSSDDVGARTDTYHVWLRDWYATAEEDGHHLVAMDGPLGMDLMVTPEKPPVLHGQNGYHWKGVDGIPSNYISYTKMKVSGDLMLNGLRVPVTGSAWMDHEFTSFRHKKNTQGWDWLAIQLDNDHEVMLYQMHRRDGSVSTDSTGTLVAPDGSAQPITMPDYRITAISNWTSPHTQATYPSGWEVDLPAIPAKLTVTPVFPDQEMVMRNSDIVYWEGACTVTGQWQGEPVDGRAYVELTGYTKPVSGRF